MAGIGFELKKLFAKKGVLNSAKAYGYAAVICTGPMLFGFILLLAITGLCVWVDADMQTRESLICMITYTLFASVMITSFFSMVVTRYVADMLFEENDHAVLPAFWGSSALMMALGSVLYGAFLTFSGASFGQGFLCFVLLNELILVWNAMNFLSAIKDYKGIFLSFLVSVVVSVLLGALLLFLGLPVIESLLFAVMVGYGMMLILDVILLHRYFPHTTRGAFTFLRWVDGFCPLAFSSLFLNVGMFAHIFIMWFSDIGTRINGLFYSAPWYEVPALLAYMTALITTVNFVVSVEVNFYPKYRNHYSLYNDKGTIDNIKQSERDMIKTLKTELFYTSLKQLLFTAVIVALGGYLLDMVPLGFNEIMRGYFRTLCVAYGVYAIGNMLMLILLYFTDYIGALIGTVVFAASSVLLTIVSLFFSNVYYGFGFLFAALIFATVTAVRLNYFTKRLPYFILAVQPLVGRDHAGPFTKLGGFLEKKLEEEKKDE
jgi:uncharacterized membrane protein